MKGVYHIWAWRPSWSSDPDAANKLSFPLPKEAPQKNLALIGQVVLEEKMFENVISVTKNAMLQCYKNLKVKRSANKRDICYKKIHTIRLVSIWNGQYLNSPGL